MGLWFSASAVTPTLSGVWGLSAGHIIWLTTAVTAGFAVGALLSALTSVSDSYPPRIIFAISDFIGAGATALITLAGGRG